ncbi:MAG: hypothetical protein U0R70_12515 [Solirubrobacteraceae bacterium]
MPARVRVRLERSMALARTFTAHGSSDAGSVALGIGEMLAVLLDDPAPATAGRGAVLAAAVDQAAVALVGIERLCAWWLPAAALSLIDHLEVRMADPALPSARPGAEPVLRDALRIGYATEAITTVLQLPRATPGQRSAVAEWALRTGVSAVSLALAPAASGRPGRPVPEA